MQHGNCPTCRNTFLYVRPPSESDDESSDGGEYIPNQDDFEDENEDPLDTDGFTDASADGFPIEEMELDVDEIWEDEENLLAIQDELDAIWEEEENRTAVEVENEGRLHAHQEQEEELQTGLVSEEVEADISLYAEDTFSYEADCSSELDLTDSESDPMSPCSEGYGGWGELDETGVDVGAWRLLGSSKRRIAQLMIVAGLLFSVSKGS